MKVLITGGTGSLAQYIIQQLEGEHELVLFDRVKPGENRFTFEIKHAYIQGDLTNGEDCAKAVAGCDAVIHLGAIPWPCDHPVWTPRIASYGIKVPPFDETVRVNTMGTYHVMYAAVQAGVKVVITAVSNCTLGHGFRISDKPFPVKYLPLDEEHPSDIEDSYSLSKLFQSEVMHSFTRAYGIHTYGISPATIMRPEQQQAHAQNIKPTEEISEWFLGYQDIEDIARAYRMCLEAYKDLPPYDDYFINADDHLAPEDSVDLLKKFRPDLLDKVRDLPGRSSFLSAAKAKKAFGWKPEYSWTRFR